MMARIYAASSWRNVHQPKIVERLRDEGHEVYDFRNPFNGVPGFAWSQIDPEWQTWSARRYRELLTTSPVAASIDEVVAALSNNHMGTPSQHTIDPMPFNIKVTLPEAL